MKKIFKRKEKEKDLVVINTVGDKVLRGDVKKINEYAKKISDALMKSVGTVYLEDIFLLFLFENLADGPSRAVHIPKDYLKAAYVLWSEGYIEHTADDRVYLTSEGVKIVNVIRRVLSK